MRRIFLLLFIALIISGCGEKTATEDPPPLVRVRVVGENLNENVRAYTGRVVSRYETPLSFQVGGEISGRFVDAGSLVKKGDIIMSISPRDTSLNVEAASAEVSAKESEANLLNINLKRYRELYAAEAIPKSQLDEIETKRDAALKALEAARANLMRAKNADSYTNLTAPMDGVITAVSAETGQIVAAGARVGAIADTGFLEAEIELSEAEFSKVSEGDAAICEFYGIEGEYVSTVREISPYANTMSRTYRVRLTIDAPPQSLTLGRSVKVKFARLTEDATIPLSAIDSEDNKTFCWVVEDNVVHKKFVNVEMSGNNEAKVNLPKGAVVVAAGIHLLRENMRVRRDDVK